VKRAFDIVAASVLILAVLPLIVGVSLAVLFDGGGPIFYRQDRVTGRARRLNGRIVWVPRRFRILKFRTMVPDADSVPVHEQFIESFVKGTAQAEAGDEPAFKLQADPRVTKVGRFLRATSLDELPQLFNVLGGSMSLVGPRPVPQYEVDLYEEHHRERLAARAGM